MKQGTITDDEGVEIEVQEPYYDLMIGEHIFFEREGDDLIEREIITGDEIHQWTTQEFIQECVGHEFREIPMEILDNPQEVLHTVIDRVLGDYIDILHDYEPWEVDLARKAVQLEKRQYALFE